MYGMYYIYSLESFSITETKGTDILKDFNEIPDN